MRISLYIRKIEILLSIRRREHEPPRVVVASSDADQRAISDILEFL